MSIHKKPIFSKLFIILSIFVVSFGELSPVYAEFTSEELEKYAQNDILYYNPYECGSGASAGGGEAVISGSTAEEKVWSGLVSLGFTEQQAAGAMGNMEGESGFNPARYEDLYKSQWNSFDVENNTSTSFGVGLIQWSFGRRVNLYKYMNGENNSLTQKYLRNPSKYSGLSGDQFIKAADSEAEANSVYSMELTFLYNEMKGNSGYSKVFSTNSVEEAASSFAVNVEGCAGCQVGTSTVAGRTNNAKRIYNKYHGKTFSGSSSSSSSSGSSSTAKKTNSVWSSTKYSLSDGQIRGLLSIVKAENGGTLSAVKTQASAMANIYEYHKKSEDHNANNFVNYIRTGGWFGSSSRYNESFSGYSNSEYEAVKDIWVNGNRTIPPEIVEHDDLLLDINYIETNGKRIYNGESGFRDKANYVQGKTIIHQNPSRISGGGQWVFWTWANPDGTTISDSSGASLTGDPFGYYEDNPPSDATSSDLECSSGSTASGDVAALQNLVLEWAYSDYRRGDTTKKAAYQAVINKSKYVGGCNGVDCGAFVYNLVVESGWDPDFPTGPTGNMETVLSSSSTWSDVTSKVHSNADALPGDVILRGASHVLIYVGDIPGFNSKMASASLCGRAPMADSASDISYYIGKGFKIYRKN